MEDRKPTYRMMCPNCDYWHYGYVDLNEWSVDHICRSKKCVGKKIWCKIIPIINDKK